MTREESTMSMLAALSYTYSTIERHVVCKPDAIAEQVAKPWPQRRCRSCNPPPWGNSVLRWSQSIPPGTIRSAMPWPWRPSAMLTQRLPTCSADDIDGLLHIKTAACMASLY